MHYDHFKPKSYLKLVKKYVFSEGEQFPLMTMLNQVTYGCRQWDCIWKRICNQQLSEYENFQLSEKENHVDDIVCMQSVTIVNKKYSLSAGKENYGYNFFKIYI